jgi:hypothetical protein
MRILLFFAFFNTITSFFYDPFYWRKIYQKKRDIRIYTLIPNQWCKKNFSDWNITSSDNYKSIYNEFPLFLIYLNEENENNYFPSIFDIIKRFF